MRDFTHFVYSAILSVIHPATTEVRTLTQNRPMSKDAVLRKVVPFRVAKPKFNIYTLFPQNRHFGAQFGGTSKFSPKRTALTWWC